MQPITSKVSSSQAIRFGGLVWFLVWLHFLMLPAAAQVNGSSAYTWTTLAGYPGTGSADGVGGAALFNNLSRLTADGAGNIYVADQNNDTIRKITPAGLVTTIAGFAGSTGSSDGIGSEARFNQPYAITMDTNTGDLFVADTGNYTIRKMTPAGTNWLVTTIAGLAGSQGSADGIGSVARFSRVCGLVMDNTGILYVTDTINSTVRKIALVGTNWMVTTIAGKPGGYGFADGVGTNAFFYEERGIAVDNAHNLYVADTFNNRIRKLTSTGTNWTVSTFAGKGLGSADGTGTNALFEAPYDVAADSTGSILYVVDQDNNTIRKITLAGVVTTLAGLAGKEGHADGTGTNASFDIPYGVAVDRAGNVYVADTGNEEVRKITPSGTVSTIAGAAGSSGSVNGTGGGARFAEPSGVVTDNSGNVYVTDFGNHTIREITPLGVVSTIAGTAGSSGGADGVGSNARFNFPNDVAMDSSGNLYIADEHNQTIRELTSSGNVTTIAGQTLKFGKTDGSGTNALFSDPSGIAVDGSGNIFVADSGNDEIRKITPTFTLNGRILSFSWVVTTIAGSFGSADGTNNSAKFYSPQGVAMDKAGDLYVADAFNATVRKITPVGTNWVVTTIAGLAGNFGSADGIGTNASFYQPDSIAVDGSGNLYVADTVNNIIRKITLVGTNWMVETIGGSADPFGPTGSQDGAGRTARFNQPNGIAVDGFGNVYVGDAANNTIRKGVFSEYSQAEKSVIGSGGEVGSLKVVLEPDEAHGQWRFGWENGWRESGTVAGNLAAGNYPIEFRSVPGYLTLQTNFTAVVTANHQAQVTNQYYPTLDDGSGGSLGSLTVQLTPGVLSGTGWRFIGETGWRASGSTADDLLPGIYDIEFEPVNGYAKPSSQQAQVYGGLNRMIAAGYLLAASPPQDVLLPFPVPEDEIDDVNDYPFGFNGQLQSDLGFGSGVAVQTNVVLTAAHLVFNDQSLSYVSQVYWYFRQETGIGALQPQAARGWYVLSGYAAQRTNDILGGLAPDQSSPQSRNLDVAALYFLSPAAGGGYGGYLPSDDSPNPWLTDNSLKMLVGYPVDGSMFGDASIVPGTMYQTQPQPYALNLAGDSVTNQQEVYTANWFLSYPGNSGGPVYAQFDGYYYPAGVYLGTLFNGITPYASAVRAIDSAVVNLIANAAALGDSGTNFTGGGVVTIVPNQAISASAPGYLEFELGPPAAVAAGAAWRLQGDTAYSSATNYVRAVTSTNAVAVEFKPVNGWRLPANQSLSVLPGQITTVTNNYVVNPPLLVFNNLGLGIVGTTGTVYQIQKSASLGGSWTAISTNAISSTATNFILPKTNNTPAAFYRARWLR